VQHFLSGFKFTKIRNLGGKLGREIVSAFGTEELTELLQVPLEQLKTKFGDETATWLYGVIRGDDHSEVSSRTQIKSMLSAKSFQPSIHTFDQAVKWLRIFVADIYARLVEEGVVENRRRPKTMNLHHRQGGQTRSRQLPIPPGKKIDENMLLDLAKTLLGQIIVDGRAWPCANLSLSVGGFEDGITGNRGIDTFLVRGDEAKALVAPAWHGDSRTSLSEEGRPEKRQKLLDEPSIEHLFGKREGEDESEDEDEDDGGGGGDDDGEEGRGAPDDHATPGDEHHDDVDDPKSEGNGATRLHQPDISSYFCKQCQKIMPEGEKDEHADWHFAKALQTQDAARARGSRPNRPESRKPSSRLQRGGLPASRGRGGRTEKGQSRLAFG
jgi:DNA polymerase eta